MKLKEELKEYSKDIVYEFYLKIVYDTKDYNRVTRTEMLNKIIEEYSQEYFLYSICTSRELEFLKIIRDKHSNILMMREYYQDYWWEIRTLCEKCILSVSSLEVYEEQKENVNNALKIYEEKGKSNYEDPIIFMISRIRRNASMMSLAFVPMIKSMFNISEDTINALMSSPLFHFYCEFSYEYFEPTKKEEEIISYRDYYDILEDVNEKRKIYGMAGESLIDIRDDFDIFYYGFPLKNKKVKKMYDELSKGIERDIDFIMLDKVRVLNDRTILPTLFKDKKLLKIINEALDETPCAVMNGFTPNEYEQQIGEAAELEEYFTSVPQNNAHLCKNAADEYYKLYFALLEYTNNKYKINKNIEKIYKQTNLNPEDLLDIDKYLWENKEKVITEFIKDNIYDFNEEELKLIDGFKTAVNGKMLVVVGFDREYTKVLSDDGKLYMIKGVTSDIDEVIDKEDLPQLINTTLLMFKGNIIYNGFLSAPSVSFGNDFKKQVLKELKTAITYYHL